MGDQETESGVETALAHLRGGRAERALMAADEAVEAEPDDARAHHVRSLVLEQLKRFRPAREAAERAAALDPGQPAFQEQLGDLWLDEDPARAERHYRESIRTDSWDRRGAARARVLNNLGVALSAQGMRREAALAFKAALLLDPSLKVAKQNTRASIQNLVRGAALLVGVNLLLKAAKTGRHATSFEALKPYKLWLVAATAVLLAASWGIWLWRRTAGMARLADDEPELYALFRRLEAERKGRGAPA
jgi:tetratricopeptide (TPR) repeat protein